MRQHRWIRATGFLTAAVIAMNVMPIGEARVHAAEAYDLYVLGTQVTDENASDVLGDGTVRYEGDADSGTLYLTDANLVSGNAIRAGYDGHEMDLTITGNGTLGSSEVNVAISSLGNLVINGDFNIYARNFGIHAAHLSITGGDISIDAATYGIVNFTTFEMSGGNVNVHGGVSGIDTDPIQTNSFRITGGSLYTEGETNYGIEANRIDIAGGCVQAHGEQCGLTALNGIEISGGIVIAEATGSDKYCAGIFSKEDVVIGESITGVRAVGPVYGIRSVYYVDISSELLVYKGNNSGSYTDSEIELLTLQPVTMSGVFDYGTVKASTDVAYAHDTIALTVEPDKGYEVDEIVIESPMGTDTATKVDDTTYTFEMPYGPATISATFKPIEYTVEFVNDDGTVLQTGTYYYDDYPVYSGEIPIKDTDDMFIYDFLDWDPAIVPVAGDAVYTATYSETPVTPTPTATATPTEVPATATPTPTDVPATATPTATSTPTPTATSTPTPVPIVYTVVSGGDGSAKKGTGSDYVITVKRSEADETCIDHFVSVTDNGTALRRDVDYTAVAGSTVITLKSPFIDSLGEGAHNITVIFDDGQVSTTLTVQKADPVPATGEGESAFEFAGVILVAAAACVALAGSVRKRKA